MSTFIWPECGDVLELADGTKVLVVEEDELGFKLGTDITSVKWDEFKQEVVAVYRSPLHNDKKLVWRDKKRFY